MRAGMPEEYADTSISSLTLAFRDASLEKSYQRHSWNTRKLQNTLASAAIAALLFIVGLWATWAWSPAGGLRILSFMLPLGCVLIHRCRHFQSKYYDLTTCLAVMASVGCLYVFPPAPLQETDYLWTLFFLFPLLVTTVFHFRSLYTYVLLCFAVCLHYRITHDRGAELGLDPEFLQLIKHQFLISCGIGYIFYRLISISRRESFARWRNEFSSNLKMKQIRDNLNKAWSAAELANRQKSLMISWISHDIRTPLHAILNLVPQVEREMDEGALQDLKRKVLTSGQMMQRMISGLLHLNTSQEADRAMQPVPLTLSGFLAETREVMEPLAAENNLSMRCRYEGPDDLVVSIRRDYLDQVILNLLTNSIKFTNSGYVALTIRAVVEGEQAHLTFGVEDSGPGFPDIEGPFELSDACMQAPTLSSSFGLGLMIAEKATQRLGAHLDGMTTSTGSSFTLRVSVPIAGPPASASGDSPPLPLPPRLSCLWVDDERLNILVGKRLLTELGIHDLRPCRTGFEAIEEHKRRPADVIFMDLAMPLMDGFETKRRLEAIPVGTPPCFIAMSAFIDREHVERALSEGFRDYLQKPFTGPELARVLRRHISVPSLILPAVIRDDPGACAEALKIIEEDVPHGLDGMRDALARADDEQLKFHAHKLRGMMTIMMLTDSADALEALERALAHGDKGAIQQAARHAIRTITGRMGALRLNGD